VPAKRSSRNVARAAVPWITAARQVLVERDQVGFQIGFEAELVYGAALDTAAVEICIEDSFHSETGAGCHETDSVIERCSERGFQLRTRTHRTQGTDERLSLLLLFCCPSLSCCPTHSICCWAWRTSTSRRDSNHKRFDDGLLAEANDIRPPRLPAFLVSSLVAIS
jgi:hypothetical protein